MEAKDARSHDRNVNLVFASACSELKEEMISSAREVDRPVKKMCAGLCLARVRMVSFPRPAVPSCCISWVTYRTKSEVPPVSRTTLPARSGISVLRLKSTP